MKLKSRGFIIIVIFLYDFIISVDSSHSQDLVEGWEYRPFVDEFEEAFYLQDEDTMAYLVHENRKIAVAECQKLVTRALALAPGNPERESMLDLAESIARVYYKQTRDAEPIKTIKRKIFVSELSPPVRSKPVNTVHIVVMKTKERENKFRPDNIIIKKGETVMWVNKDTVDHVLASQPLLGEIGISSPSLMPGQTYKYWFREPGEYYYTSYIYKGMKGMVTVEE